MLSPVTVAGTVTVNQNAAAVSLRCDELIVSATGRLTHPPLASLSLEVTGALVVQSGGHITATIKGYNYDYSSADTYPGEARPSSDESGGNHLGFGGDGTGTTYGSVYRPQELGARGRRTSHSMPGGGVVRIVAASIELEGGSTIQANGGYDGNGNEHRGKN